MPRVLLVEDEQVNRELFRRRLERKGYEVITAETGLQAVERSISEKPDLVLMDLGLPDIDGWEAMRRLKSESTTAAIPIIVLSAHASVEARQQAFAAGCEEFETKPVNWETLFKKIDEAIERAKTRPIPEVLTEATTQMLLPPLAAPTKLRKVNKDSVDDPKRILVVEDNDANRVMLCRRLNKSGYITTEAADGREALNAVQKERFDLVLCDIMMPGVDGYEVLREMKADPDLQAIPIIMISALDEMASIVRCIEMGAEDYLQKPYDPVLLNARINACLDKRRLRDQEMEYLRAVSDLTQAAALVEQGKFDSAMLAAVASRDDALGTLARVFDRMAREVQAREQQLRSDMQRLMAVEIDQKELVREISRVTSSDAFDKARRHAEEVRARRQQRAAPASAHGGETLVLPRGA